MADTEGVGPCCDRACQQERLAIQHDSQLAVQGALQQLAVAQARLTAAGASEEQLRADNTEWKVGTHTGFLTWVACGCRIFVDFYKN